MMPILSENLSSMACRSIGETAFLLAMPTDLLCFTPDMRGLHLSYRGEFRGKIIIYLSPEILKEMTLNMLGMSDHEIELTEDVLEDAMKEFGNVLLGHMLVDIYGEGKDIRIGIPTLLEKSQTLTQFKQSQEPLALGLKAHQIVSLDVEGAPLIIEMREFSF